jgi:hypothetical protein
MGFDLLATLRLSDQMSRPLRSATSNLIGFGNRITGITAGMSALTAAVTGVTGATKLFNSTIGAAAKSEMATMSMTALFKGNEKSAKEFYDYIQQKGAESVLSDDDFMAASRTFAIMTKDMDELKELVNIGERLAVMDPAQGIEGAAVALRELSSGDIVSLKDRFEIPKNVLDKIKNLPLKKQLAALDKELSNYGVTQEMIYAQGNTALGLYNKTADKTRVIFRNMGFGALEELKPMLRDINAWLDKNSVAITKFGSDLITDVAGGFRRAFDYVKVNYLDNEEFMSLPFDKKVTEVLDAMKSKFDKWFDTSGREMIRSNTQKAVDTMLSTLDGEGNLGKVWDIGKDVGETIGGGIIAGLDKAIEKHPLIAGLAAGMAMPGPIQAKLIAGVAVAADGMLRPVENKAIEATRNFSDKIMPKVDFLNHQPTKGEKDILNVINFFGKGVSGAPEEKEHSNSGGISRVPYNGYLTRLHKDESVLPAAAARDYRNSGGASGGVTVNMNGAVTVRQDSDINRVAGELYRLINSADNAMGGAY